MSRNREQIITSMCFTWRHDYGLMTDEERASLWGRMAQIFDNDISPHIEKGLEARTVSRPGAVLEVKAVPIPPKIQSMMASAIRGESKRGGGWVKTALFATGILATLFLVRTYLDPIHRERINALREPPRPRLSDYPSLERHCVVCARCRGRFALIEAGGATWDSPPLCEEGMRLFNGDFLVRWEKLK